MEAVESPCGLLAPANQPINVQLSIDGAFDHYDYYYFDANGTTGLHNTTGRINVTAGDPASYSQNLSLTLNYSQTIVLVVTVQSLAVGDTDKALVFKLAALKADNIFT